MTLTCKWITDKAGPLVCRKGEFSYSWSICASGTECPGGLSAHIRSARSPEEPSAAGSPNQRMWVLAAD